MKITNLKNEIISEKSSENSSENYSVDSVVSSSSAQFDEVVVYNELADQSLSKIHLLQQIHLQLSQLEVMVARRKFLLNQVSEIIIKD